MQYWRTVISLSQKSVSAVYSYAAFPLLACWLAKASTWNYVAALKLLPQCYIVLAFSTLRQVICIYSNFTSTLFSGGVPQNVSQWDLVPGEHQQDLQGRHLQQLFCQLPDLGLPRSGRLLRPHLRLWDDLQRNRGFDICHRCSGKEMKRKWNTYLLLGKKTCHVSNMPTKNVKFSFFSSPLCSDWTCL